MAVHYLDMTMAGGVFRIPAECATQLISCDLFVPSVAADGLARCHVVALQYRTVDILYPYNEVAVTIPGRLRGVDRQTDLHYYLHLPVTTEDGRWPGVELYGFPKYIAAIDFDESESELACSLKLVGQEVLTLYVTKGPATDAEWDVENITFLDGDPILSTFRSSGQRYASDLAGGARLRFSDHLIGQELQSSQIEPTSVSHFYCPSMTAVLSAPIRLETVRSQRPVRSRGR